MSSLTFVYEDSTAVLGPLSASSEPHAYDLCREHASGMTAPRGWELLRVPGSGGEVSDDLVALADAVRPRSEPTEEPGQSPTPPPRTRRRTDGQDEQPGRHLHVLRSTHD